MFSNEIQNVWLGLASDGVSSFGNMSNAHSTWPVVLQVLPKIRSFFWCALSNAIPIFLNLFRRRLTQDPICPICFSHEESIEHTLLLCPWVDAVWFGPPLGLSICKHRVTTLDDWVLQFYQATSSKTEKDRLFTLVGFLCWSIWKCRCSFVYQGIPLSPIVAIESALVLLNEYLESRSAHTSLQATQPSPSSSSWTPPLIHQIKINCDAA